MGCVCVHPTIISSLEIWTPWSLHNRLLILPELKVEPSFRGQPSQGVLQVSIEGAFKFTAQDLLNG